MPLTNSSGIIILPENGIISRVGNNWLNIVINRILI
jgi:hypothetical protein